MKYKINYSIGGALQPIVTPIQTLQPNETPIQTLQPNETAIQTLQQIVTPMQRVARIPISEVETQLINPLAETMSNKQIIQTCSVNKTFCQNMNWENLIEDRNINIETVLNLDDIIPTICNNTIDVQLPFCRKFYNYTKYEKYTKHFNTIAAGGFHSMALQNDGTVVVWGNNEYDQCDEPDGLNSVVSIAAGWDHCMALKNDGTVVVWGSSRYGLRDAPAGLNNVVAIAAGGFHSMALQNNGTVSAWGRTNEDQCNVPPGLNNVVSIAAGAYHSMALQNDGTVRVWGNNGYGQRDGIPADLIARVP